MDATFFTTHQSNHESEVALLDIAVYWVGGGDKAYHSALVKGK